LAEKAAQVIEISRNARKKLADEMTPREVAEAERQAATWIKENREQVAKPFPPESYHKLRNRKEV
jgi:hypothetical protein